MKNTKIALDIIFISANKTVIDIKQNFQPCIKEPCETYTSKPAQYTLEVNEGFAIQHGIKTGTVVKF